MARRHQFQPPAERKHIPTPTHREVKGNKRQGKPTLLPADDTYEALSQYEGIATPTDFCRVLNIQHTTYRKWYKDIPEFRAAIDLKRAEADDEVVHALRKRALGYDVDYTEETTKEGTTAKGHEIDETSVKTGTTHIPPDTQAAFRWLQNRQPKDWADRKQVEVSVKYAELIEDLEDYVDFDLPAEDYEELPDDT